MADNNTDLQLQGLLNMRVTLLHAENVSTFVNEELLFNMLQGLVTNVKWTPTDVTELFRALLKRFESTSTNDRAQLHSWMMKMLHCIEMNYVTPSLKFSHGQTIMQLVQDRTITDENLLELLGHDTEKQLDEILEEIRQEKLNQTDETLLNEVKDIVSSVHQFIRGRDSRSGGSQKDGLKKDLLTLCRAVKRTQGITPRLTQMVSWCLMALSKSGWLIQVGTGEGKSCIVAMFAAYRAMRGEKVDIMSSSPVLAERDCKDWKKFYDHLKIRVDCNTNKFHHEQLKMCYEHSIVYGTAEKFAGDWLTQRFERMEIFGQRKFQCAIVDEVDSQMLDNALQMVYIGTDIPALQHLSAVFALVWSVVRQYGKIGSHYEEAVVTAAEVEIKCNMRFTPCELSQDTNICYVPGFLKDLVNSKLKVWIENAFKAQTMTEGHEYIIEGHAVVPVDYSSTGVVQNNMTLTDGLQQFLEMKHQTRLSDMSVITNYMSNVGLLQKYGDQIYGMSGTIGQQSETEVLQKIYPGIKICQIPLFKRRKLFEVEGMIVENEEEWIEKICSVVTVQVNRTLFRAGRAVLVICETIKGAESLHRVLRNQVQCKSLYINSNMDNSATFEKNLEPGDVIIATNLAGRGTDLKVSDQVNHAGGLFVVQTFLPKNARVEQQAFGRTARQGFPGSAQLIICSSHLSETLQLRMLTDKLHSLLKKITTVPQQAFVMQFRSCQRSHGDEESVHNSTCLTLTNTSNSGMQIAKKVRDEFVAEALSNFLDRDIPMMKKKEELFSQYLAIRDDLCKSSRNKPVESDLATLNEIWGIWLLTNFNEKDSLVDLKTRLDADMQKARQKLTMGESSSSILHHYTRFGNDLRTKGKLAESIKMYTKAKRQDHCWAAIAQYNRAFATLATLTQQDRRQDRNCINRALQDLENALKSLEFYSKQIEVTYTCSRRATETPVSHSDSRFGKHMNAKYMVYVFFKANISEAIKKLQTARDRGRDVKVEEKSVYLMAPLLCLIPFEIFTNHSLTQLLSKDVQKMQQLLNDPSFDIFRELMCLESLGLTHVYTLDTLFSLGGFLSRMLRIFD